MTTVAMGMFLLLAPILVAQQRPTLETILDDASYVFNRYDELTAGVIRRLDISPRWLGARKENIGAIE